MARTGTNDANKKREKRAFVVFGNYNKLDSLTQQDL
jgi:hypothetical protein